MAKGFKRGAGGVGLNFKVIPNPRPETARENTIWVNTDDKITCWAFCPIRPTEPVEGMVHIGTGINGSVSIDILKRNDVLLYPLFAEQYVNGEWIDKEAQCYQDSTWKDLTYYLFYDGNQMTYITGGFSSVGYSYYSTSYAITDPEVSNVVKLSTTNGGQCVAFGSQKKIDLTGYNKLCVKCEALSGGSVPCLVIPKDDRNLYGSYTTALSEISSIGYNYLDISNIDGLNFVAIRLASSSTNKVNSATISEFWLER